MLAPQYFVSGPLLRSPTYGEVDLAALHRGAVVWWSLAYLASLTPRRSLRLVASYVCCDEFGCTSHVPLALCSLRLPLTDRV